MKHTKRTINVVLLVLIALLSLQLVTAIGIGTFETEFEYTPDQISSIKYYIVKEKDEMPTVSLDFIGNLSQYAEFRIDNSWYSTRLDELDVSLTRSFDLTSVESATLTFYTKYDIEYGWDFGYVEISTNNGSSWTQLAGTTTTTYRAPGSYVGINGAPAYTGSVADWTLETIDLTPYVGNDILLKFRYISDSYYVENGWFVDDISITEIGFFDDVRSENTTWTSNGWLKNIVHLNDSSKTIPIYIDFTIPKDYVSDNTIQKLVATEVPGTDQGYNPSYGSVETVIANFPQVVRIDPPAPIPPDDATPGGGSENRPPHSRIIGDTITFFIDEFVSGGLIELSLDDRKDIVRSIHILIKEFIEDAVLRITHLPEKPESIKQELPEVYKYFEISTLNLFNSGIDNIVIRVAVDKSWIRNKDVNPEDIVVSRFSMGVWSDLETGLVDEELEYYIFDAVSPGFSVFAIRIRSPIPSPNIILPIPTAKPNITDMKPVLVIIGNESTDDIANKITEELKQKSGITEDNVDISSLPLTIVSTQQPTTDMHMWSNVLIVLLVVSGLFMAIIMFIFRPKGPVISQTSIGTKIRVKKSDNTKTIRKKPARKIVKSDEKKIDGQIQDLLAGLKDE